LCLWNAGAPVPPLGSEALFTCAVVLGYLGVRYLRGHNGRRVVSKVSRWIRRKADIGIDAPRYPWQRALWSCIHRPGRTVEFFAVIIVWSLWLLLRMTGTVQPSASNLAGIHLLWVTTMLFLTHWLRHSIERSFHYQRIREVVYVLELAHLGYRENPRFIDGLMLNPPQDTEDPPIAARVTRRRS
jgi:hypothetical protein